MNTNDTIDAYVGSLLTDSIEPPAMSETVATAKKLPTEASIASATAPLPVNAPATSATNKATAAPALKYNNDTEYPAATEAAQATRWLLMSVAGNHYGLELLRIQEVVRVSLILSMRGTPERVLGVMNLRGRAVPVIDLGLHLLGTRVDPENEQSRIVVVEYDNELLGVLVSAVRDVATINPGIIEPAIDSRRIHVNGIARIGRLPIVLLEADDLFAA